MLKKQLLSIGAVGTIACALVSVSAPAMADDQDTFERMCGEYHRMMRDGDHRMGMGERWRRWWYGDRGPRRGGYGMMQRFGAIDQNDDGTVSAEEASANVEHVFTTMDANEDGVLEMDEFMAVRMGFGRGWNKARQEARQESKKARFAEMDSDNDGKVSQAEFIEAGRKRYAEADTDKDGKVTPWEFRAQRRIF